MAVCVCVAVLFAGHSSRVHEFIGVVVVGKAEKVVFGIGGFAFGMLCCVWSVQASV